MHALTESQNDNYESLPVLDDDSDDNPFPVKKPKRPTPAPALYPEYTLYC